MPTELTLHVISAADVVAPPRLDGLGGIGLAAWIDRESGGQLRLGVREHQSAQLSEGIAGDGLQAMFREFVPCKTGPHCSVDLSPFRNWYS